MRVEGINSNVGASAGGVALGSARELSKDFMRLLVAQLQNQDPLQPLQDRELVAQLAQLSSLETLQRIEALATAEQGLTQLSQAASLIGRMVTATSSEGVVRGTVKSVVVGTDRQVYLDIGENVVRLTDIQSVAV